MKGHAPGWQIRCPKCDRVRDASEAGVVRIKAAAAGKRILGWCSRCNRPRLLVVERKPAPEKRTVADAGAS